MLFKILQILPENYTGCIGGWSVQCVLRCVVVAWRDDKGTVRTAVHSGGMEGR